MTPLGSWFPTPGFCDVIMHFFLCEDLATPEGAIARDEDEQIEPAMVSVATVREMIADGRIVDMKTMVGLSLLDARRPLR